jgi:pyridinium-3,5-biscarboxylic acid mononucleotide sulfurtransferase
MSFAMTFTPPNWSDPVSERLARIQIILDMLDHTVVACSGGIDSTLLAVVAHRRAPGRVTVAHAISAAVPPEATERVRALASQEGWDLSIVQSGEFQDENYLSNPVNRCYFCKSNLYDSLMQIAAAHDKGTVVSGANLDDLGEYRPGLDAAAERGVRHPWIEAHFAKADIRALARDLALPFAELPSSPCLASRLYTGTRVTAERLRAVHACETLVRQQTGLDVVRCRVRGAMLIVEVAEADRPAITTDLLAELRALAASSEPGITTAVLDAEAYRPGRAFVGNKERAE